MDQDEIFDQEEGDNWFRRNKGQLGKEPDWVPWILSNFENDVTIKSVLELGCSNGWRLQNLKTFSEGSENPNIKITKLVGIDPSAEAIADGKSKYPSVDFVKGLLADVPVREKFDLVIVSFVLHWVDRAQLSKSISEIDRLVADGGLLIVSDFLPDHPNRTPYAHWKKDQVFTFKQNYSKIFEALGIYREIAHFNFKHDEISLKVQEADSHHRGYWSLMKKSLTDYYPLSKVQSIDQNTL